MSTAVSLSHRRHVWGHITNVFYIVESEFKLDELGKSVNLDVLTLSIVRYIFIRYIVATNHVRRPGCTIRQIPLFRLLHCNQCQLARMTRRCGL